jgi:hypothetical protein
MKLRFVAGVISLASFTSCGKTESPPAQTSGAVVARPEKPAPASAEKPAEPAAALADTAVAPPSPAAERPAEPAADPTAPKAADTAATKTGLPGWWATLFVEGQVLTYDVTEKVDTSEMNEEDPSIVTTTEKNLTGVLTCTVKSVMADGDKKTSTVACVGHSSESGIEASPAGTWVTDGKSLWEKHADDRMELHLEHPPVAKKTGDEEIEQEWSESKDAPGTWCFDESFLIGDGGGTEVCFTEKDGPVSFHAVGGSAMSTSDVTATLKR